MYMLIILMKLLTRLESNKVLNRIRIRIIELDYVLKVRNPV